MQLCDACTVHGPTAEVTVPYGVCSSSSISGTAPAEPNANGPPTPPTTSTFVDVRFVAFNKNHHSTENRSEKGATPHVQTHLGVLEVEGEVVQGGQVAKVELGQQPVALDLGTKGEGRYKGGSGSRMKISERACARSMPSLLVAIR
jgi:hypothetical protein